MRSTVLVLAVVMSVASEAAIAADGAPSGPPIAGQAKPSATETTKPAAPITERKGLAFTEAAGKRIKQIIAEQKLSSAVGVRIGCTAGGCTGFLYEMKFDENFDAAQDLVFNSHGVRVVVDKKSLVMIDGTIIGFYEGGAIAGFTFDNPKAKKSETPAKHRSDTAEDEDGATSLARRINASRSTLRPATRNAG